MSTRQLPAFLTSAESFANHLYEQFSDSTNSEKGDRFLEFAMSLVTFFEQWRDYETPTPNAKKTHDKGVDFFAKSIDGTSVLCGQSKYRIKTIADIDAIVSAFQNFSLTDPGATAPQPELFGAGDQDNLDFVVITPAKIDGLVKKYRKSNLSARAYFDDLEEAGRITFIDRDKIFPLLERMYRQNYIPDPEIAISFSSDVLEVGNVLLSTVSGATLQTLYEEHGSSLFFENIREFLGIPETGKRGKSDDDAVNAEILDTLVSAPEKMLSRNNGITMKAEKIISRDRHGIRASKCSIVNGCQTTMCVVSAGAAAQDAQVVIKIVEGGDPWDIAKTANYQNRVTRLELELAQFLRPQRVRKAATDFGLAIDPSEEPTVSNILSSVHQGRVSYEFIRIIYLGVFSRSPRNIFNSNYSEVRVDVLREFAANGEDERLLETLFQLMIAAKSAASATASKLDSTPYLEYFKRFFEDSRPKYQGIIAITAACSCTGINLADKPSGTDGAYAFTLRFIVALEKIIAESRPFFEEVFGEVFMLIADRVLSSAGASDSDIKQLMYRATESSSSGEAFRRILGISQMKIQTRSLREKYGLEPLESSNSK